MSQIPALAFVALILGLGWAVRGHFGHEYGAAWAGGMSVLALVAASGRRDWLRRLPSLAVLGAIGWAAGGMMSYGRIVGFGRAGDLWNVLYGLGMLAVVGALYGFIGGGLLGLGLETTPEKKPDWASLITQMVAGGFLFWGVLIHQFEWRMTPPRSELWAACLGAAAALAWYLARNGFPRTLSVAGWSALGAGLGFALGNFLQTMGSLSGSGLNWWNLMEFTLGFSGGLGMAYGVFSRDWPVSASPSPTGQWVALLVLVAVIPFINLANAFRVESLAEEAKRLAYAASDSYALRTFLLAGLGVVVFSCLCAVFWRKSISAAPILFTYSTYYVVFGHIRKGVFAGSRIPVEHLLYWLILAGAAMIWLLAGKRGQTPFRASQPSSWKRWAVVIGAAFILTLVLSLISICSHDGLPGAQQRFQARGSAP